jgi:hypothetical protein
LPLSLFGDSTRLDEHLYLTKHCTVPAEPRPNNPRKTIRKLVSVALKLRI